MIKFEMKEIREAIAYSNRFGQALHIHTINAGHKLFKRYPVIGHLFDLDKDRLIRTATKLGVRVIKIEYEGTARQHIDLCGKPFDRAVSEAEPYIPCHLIPHLYDKDGLCLHCGHVKVPNE